MNSGNAAEDNLRARFDTQMSRINNPDSGIRNDAKKQLMSVLSLGNEAIARYIVARLNDGRLRETIKNILIELLQIKEDENIIKCCGGALNSDNIDVSIAAFDILYATNHGMATKILVTSVIEDERMANREELRKRFLGLIAEEIDRIDNTRDEKSLERIKIMNRLGYQTGMLLYNGKNIEFKKQVLVCLKTKSACRVCITILIGTNENAAKVAKELLDSYLDKYVVSCCIEQLGKYCDKSIPEAERMRATQILMDTIYKREDKKAILKLVIGKLEEVIPEVSKMLIDRLLTFCKENSMEYLIPKYALKAMERSDKPCDALTDLLHSINPRTIAKHIITLIAEENNGEKTIVARKVLDEIAEKCLVELQTVFGDCLDKKTIKGKYYDSTIRKLAEENNAVGRIAKESVVADEKKLREQERELKWKTNAFLRGLRTTGRVIKMTGMAMAKPFSRITQRGISG